MYYCRFHFNCCKCLTLKYFTEIFTRNSDWVLDDVIDDVSAVMSIPSRILNQQCNKNARHILLATSAYISILLAIRRGYDDIVKPLFQHAR